MGLQSNVPGHEYRHLPGEIMRLVHEKTRYRCVKDMRRHYVQARCKVGCAAAACCAGATAEGRSGVRLPCCHTCPP